MALTSLVSVACSGCTIYIGPFEGSDATAGPKRSILPDPKEGPMTAPTLDAAQQARQEEAERYTAEVVYKGGEVVAAFQLPSGDILDFIHRDTLPALPYALPPLPFSPAALVLPPGVEFGLTELTQSSELLQLAATATPFHRPTFWPYVLGEAPDATSIDDYLARYEVAGKPVDPHRLYAGLTSLELNRGVSGYVNQYRPEVVPDSFSLIELAVACPAEAPTEMVGVAISVDKLNHIGKNGQVHADDEARLHIEYSRIHNGEDNSRWDGAEGEFVANPFRVHHPGQIVPVSVLDATAIEHLLAVFQAPTGDWWIAFDGDLLGYYPAKMFTTLSGSGCVSSWYGEVARKEVLMGNIKAEMGSGEFAEEGLLNAAHVRNPRFYDLSWFEVEPKIDFWPLPMQSPCYSRMPLMHLAAPWDSSFFFLGGPGGKNPACQWP